LWDFSFRKKSISTRRIVSKIADFSA